MNMHTSLVIEFDNLPKLARDTPQVLALQVDQFFATVLQEAAANTPVITGGLRASRFRITPIQDDFDSSVSAFLAANPVGEPAERPDVGKDDMIAGFSAGYALAVHDGHHTPSGAWVPGNPFLMDAAQAHLPELEQFTGKAMLEHAESLSQ